VLPSSWQFFWVGGTVQVITYLAPTLAAQLHIDRSLLGPVFSAGLAGTVLGALAIAPLSDRLGRRSVLAACVLLFSVCSLGTALATSVEGLVVWRFLGGLGLGGATPIAVALTAEYTPKRVRGTAVMIVYCGFAVGAAVGGLLSTVLIKAFGWQSVFLVGGAMPLFIFAFIMLRLPESISFLAMQRKKPFLIARYVKEIDPSIHLDPHGEIVVDERAKGFPVSQLFAEGRTGRTLVLWLMFFGNILSLYFMVSWFPTLTHAAGVPIESAVIASALIQAGSIAGTFTLAGLVRKFDTFTVMSLGYAGGAISLILMSLAAASVPYVMLVAFLGGFFVIGTQTGANGIGSIVYPASIRATGVGWALGIGRFGAVLGPLAGGVLVASNWPASSLYVVAAVPTAVAALCALGLSRMLKRDNAELSTEARALSADVK
jgi:AAHS family 4-hydroxybenzoate transporter-like MFS transporter